MAHTHTLLCSSFSSVRRESLHLLLSSGRSSYFRMVFCSFHVLPIFLLAHPADLVDSGPRRCTRAPAGSCDPTLRGVLFQTALDCLDLHAFPFGNKGKGRKRGARFGYGIKVWAMTTFSAAHTLSLTLLWGSSVKRFSGIWYYTVVRFKLYVVLHCTHTTHSRHFNTTRGDTPSHSTTYSTTPQERMRSRNMYEDSTYMMPACIPAEAGPD